MAIQEAARQHGYKYVLFDSSLSAVLERLIAGAESLEDTIGVVIKLDDVRDPEFKALQVLNRKQATYTSRGLAQVLLLQNYAGPTILEGSPLTAIANRYIVIVGTTTYRTAVGSRQAIVIETAR
ncbi:MAG: hypothetical protein R3A78_05755 [Polyangiales bacterium]